MNRLNTTESTIFIYLMYSLLPEDLTIQNLLYVLVCPNPAVSSTELSESKCVNQVNLIKVGKEPVNKSIDQAGGQYWFKPGFTGPLVNCSGRLVY